jgi:hypothetical protein
MRTMRFASRTLAFFALSLSAFHANAHHSPVMFDQTRQFVLNGVITRFDWTNPHVYLHLRAQNDAGQTIVWAVEAQSPQVMTRFGWSTRSVTIGDRVTVAVSPLRNGESGRALGRSVQKQDGTTLKISWEPDEIREAIRAQAPTRD